MSEKLSFNKRIALTKTETFKAIQDTGLDKTANSKAGYYSLKSIMIVLNPLLEKYDLDLDLSLEKNTVVIKWFDCESEKVRLSSVDVSAIEGIDRLPSMSNMVQSMGACMTYVRRYAYTVVLNLNATDLIENATGSNKNTTSQQKPPSQPKYTKPAPTALEVEKTTEGAKTAQNTIKKISEPQRKRLFAIAKGDEALLRDICTKCGYESTKDISMADYNTICDLVESSEVNNPFEGGK